MTTLLGTGIRVSELVGLDLKDIDFTNGRLKMRYRNSFLHRCFVTLQQNSDAANATLISKFPQLDRLQPTINTMTFV